MRLDQFGEQGRAILNGSKGFGSRGENWIQPLVQRANALRQYGTRHEDSAR
jgi:hypothetical protein